MAKRRFWRDNPVGWLLSEFLGHPVRLALLGLIIGIGLAAVFLH